MKHLKYLVYLFLPALIIVGYNIGGWYNFLMPLICLWAYPVANLFLSASEEQAHAVFENSSAYIKITLLFVPVLIALTGWCVYNAGTQPLDIIEITGLAFSLGLVNGILGFTLAHEFIHRRKKLERFAGYLLLLQNNYLHYCDEHIRGHHVNACTPEDPHTARIGETIYSFLPRTFFQTYMNAIKIERKRLGKKKYKIPLLHNRLVWFAVLQLGLIVSIFFLLNEKALLFFIAQNMVAIQLLNIVEYLQHYGLMRQKNESGGYKKMDAQHAWETGKKNNVFSLFGLENHADHHLHPGKFFTELTQVEDSPKHPAGYSFMVFLVFIPPLWFKIMNKRIPSNFKTYQL